MSRHLFSSSSDDTWVTDDSADEDTASVDPAFDRQRPTTTLQLGIKARRYAALSS